MPLRASPGILWKKVTKDAEKTSLSDAFKKIRINILEIFAQ